MLARRLCLQPRTEAGMINKPVQFTPFPFRQHNYARSFWPPLFKSSIVLLPPKKKKRKKSKVKHPLVFLASGKEPQKEAEPFISRKVLTGIEWNALWLIEQRTDSAALFSKDSGIWLMGSDWGCQPEPKDCSFALTINAMLITSNIISQSFYSWHSLSYSLFLLWHQDYDGQMQQRGGSFTFNSLAQEGMSTCS